MRRTLSMALSLNCVFDSMTNECGADAISQVERSAAVNGSFGPFVTVQKQERHGAPFPLAMRLLVIGVLHLNGPVAKLCLFVGLFVRLLPLRVRLKQVWSEQQGQQEVEERRNKTERVGLAFALQTVGMFE